MVVGGATRGGKRAAHLLQQGESASRCLVKLGRTSVMLALLVEAASALGIFERADRPWADLWTAVMATRRTNLVVVVHIGDKDFNAPELFRGETPLDPAVLSRLLERIREHRPRVCALDIFVDPRVREGPVIASGRERLYRTLGQYARSGPRLVVIRDRAQEVDSSLVDSTLWAAWKTLLRDARRPGSRLIWAEPYFDMNDGVVRDVRAEEAPHGSHDAHFTVFGAVLASMDKTSRAVPSRKPWGSWGARPYRIRFSGEFSEPGSGRGSGRIPARDLLNGEYVQGQTSLLEGKVVLVGASHHDIRDLYATPLGEMPGVDIWAESLATWERGDEIRHLPRWLHFVVESLLGIIAGVLLLRYGSVRGTIYSLVLLSAAAVGYSFLAFGVGGYFVSLMPSVAGVVGHYQYNVYRAARGAVSGE